jgi:hypothetical protein
MASALWAFRLDVSDMEGELLVDVTFGLSHAVEDDASGRSAVRALSAHACRALRDVVETHGRELQESLAAAAARHAQVAANRERAIANLLARRQASLASALAQRELFGELRHAGTAADRDAIAHALRACQEQLERLDRWRQATGSVTPVFAIFRPA